MTRQHIRVPDLRKYRTELPNLLDDLELDPYAFRLLAHYYRVGDCWESTRTTARKCAMSVGKVSAARRGLQERGLIEIGENGHGTLQIRVVDIWPQNFQNYARGKRVKGTEIKERAVKNAPCKQAVGTAGKGRVAKKGLRAKQDALRRFAEGRFIELSRLSLPSRQSEASELWWYPLREICQLAAWEESRAALLIQRALTRLRENGMTISSPKSILKTARAIAGELQTGGAGGSESAKEWEARVFDPLVKKPPPMDSGS